MGNKDNYGDVYDDMPPMFDPVRDRERELENLVIQPAEWMKIVSENCQSLNGDVADQYSRNSAHFAVRLALRYGFRIPREDAVYDSSVSQNLDNADQFKKAYIKPVMEEITAQDVASMGSGRRHVATFVANLANPSNDVWPLSCMFDLRLLSPHFLMTASSSVLVVVENRILQSGTSSVLN